MSATTKTMDVPISQKANLTIKEASALFNIGEKKLYDLTGERSCKFVLYIGTKRLIKRAAFEKYLEGVSSL